MSRVHSFLILALALVPALSFAKDKSEAVRCAERVKEHCYLSNNDFDRIEDNVASCKEVNANGDKLEVFQLRDAGKIVVVNTNARGSQYCSTTKYTMDSQGIKTIKVISGNLFMLAHSGRVFIMLSDEAVYEMLNAKGKAYSNVQEIKGANSGNSIRLIGPGYDNEFSMADIREKANKGQLSKINFYRTHTDRSLFRDE